MKQHDPNLLDTALRYARNGIAVFPLRVRITGGKKTITPIGHYEHTNGERVMIGWDQHSTTDQRTITGWFRSTSPWNRASLGIDCGKSGLVVIDLDTDIGIGNWDTFTTRHRLAATWRAQTPSGGRHWYYRADPTHELGNSCARIAPRIDTRGAGGFVIAPPSTDTRGRYAWLEGEPNWPDLPVIPHAVVTALTTRKPPARESHHPKGNGTRRKFTHDQAVEFCRPWMDALSVAGEGTRNHTLNIAAKVLSHFVPAFWTRPQAETWLTNALDPSYPREEADRTIDSAFRSADTDWVAEASPGSSHAA